MTLSALIALLPLIAVALAAVVVMLTIAFRRNSGWPFRLTLLGLAMSLLLLPLSLKLAPSQVTGLMRIDAYAVLFIGLLGASAAFVASLCNGYFRAHEREEVYVLLLTSTLGGMMLVASTHFAMLFLGLEILSVSLFPMIAFRSGHKPSLEAGIKYLILSGVSSALVLFGMALIYSASGALSFFQLSHVSTALGDPLVIAGTLLLIAGLAFKLSLVPFHLWTPDIYEGAPAPITVFIATVSKTAVFAMLVRFWVAQGISPARPMLILLGIIGAVSILTGNLLALRQRNLKRILGYSSIAHMGYALAAFVAASVTHSSMMAEAVGLYLLAYLITNLCALGVVSVLSTDANESVQITDYEGLFWRQPTLATTLTVSLLSLAGIPLTIGFIGKFYMFAATTQASLWLLLAAVVIGSGFGLYYYLGVILTMLIPIEDHKEGTSARASTKPALVLLVAILLGGGVFPEPLMKVFQAVAKSMT